MTALELGKRPGRHEVVGLLPLADLPCLVLETHAGNEVVGVEQVMRAEAMETAEATLAKHAAYAREKVGIEAEPVVREGLPVEQIHALIEEDQDIAILVLAAGAAKEGPGPLVSSIAGRNAAFPIPVTVVPYNLSDEDIESLS